MHLGCGLFPFSTCVWLPPFFLHSWKAQLFFCNEQITVNKKRMWTKGRETRRDDHGQLINNKTREKTVNFFRFDTHFFFLFCFSHFFLSLLSFSHTHLFPFSTHIYPLRLSHFLPPSSTLHNDILTFSTNQKEEEDQSPHHPPSSPRSLSRPKPNTRTITTTKTLHCRFHIHPRDGLHASMTQFLHPG